MPATHKQHLSSYPSILPMMAAAWASLQEAGARPTVGRPSFPQGGKPFPKAPNRPLCLSHQPELSHMLTLKQIDWQEWNLHSDRRLGSKPTFSKVHRHAKKTTFFNKIEALLEKNRVVKGYRKVTSRMCYSH